ncbi:MAG: protein-export chaperone SecB [Halorhodospira halophila]|uniref:protein-export chaperone SecB n=1 Tax=Halorhodospira TaxID=85108 RepID=UPI001914254F|nr:MULTISPECIES: protein-export chaperone SecB [Halorhodospira]MBK5936343.1 protein-export chaperone SecB [Halorhodospira halophila]MBK5943568.1 protein-export chaperone SecB [Halorhodospira halophila]MCC3750127.1 protein-export chaperone SecB [Halorhodospira halophila]MCG5527099.1 protein-export chaperone SecB [Halorhodospira halophila]MCG5534282.1 protein-export chaperone SecB [Halorhodospira sp. 9621]
MAENNGNGSTGATDAGQRQRFQIAKMYLRDVSFEAPSAPEAFRDEWKPQLDVELGTRHQPLGENTYDVVLTVTVTARNNERTAYLCEVKQGGVFRLEGFPEADMERVLGAYCPAQLFPFAREAINDLVVKGGFPQLLLAPVNFESLYQQQKQRREQGNADSAPAGEQDGGRA